MFAQCLHIFKFCFNLKQNQVHTGSSEHLTACLRDLSYNIWQLLFSNWDMFVQGLRLSDSDAGHPWIPGGVSRADARLVPPSTPTSVSPRQNSRERSVPLTSRKCVSYFLLVEGWMLPWGFYMYEVLCLQMHSTLLWHGTRGSNLAGILSKGFIFACNCSLFHRSLF